MKKYTICICDDEEHVRKELRKHILQFSFMYNVEIEIFELDSAEKLLQFQPLYDILLLDIQFGNRNIGIDVAEQLRAGGNTSIIILITSLAVMSIDGYRAEPYRFVVKPVTSEIFTSLMNACICKLNRTVPYIKIKSNSISETIRADYISHIYSKLRKRNVVCTDGNVISTWQSFCELMKQLPERNFVFAHKSYLVNIYMVKTVIYNKIVLTNGVDIPLSPHYENLFMKALQVIVHE